jgi:hypothetical protein
MAVAADKRRNVEELVKIRRECICTKLLDNRVVMLDEQALEAVEMHL